MSDDRAPADGAKTISEFDLESLSLSLSSIVQSIVQEHMEWARQAMDATSAQMLQQLNAANMQMMHAMQMGMPPMGMPQMPMGMPHMGMPQMPMGMPPMGMPQMPMGMPPMGMPQMPMGMPPMGMPQMPPYGPGWENGPGEADDGSGTSYGQANPYDPMRQNMEVMQKQAEVIALLKKFVDAGEVLAKAGNDRLKTVLADYIAGLNAQSEAQRKSMAAMQADNLKTQESIAGIQNSMHDTSMKAAQARHKLQVETAAAMTKTTAEGIAAQQKSFNESNELIRKALKGELY